MAKSAGRKTANDDSRRVCDVSIVRARGEGTSRKRYAVKNGRKVCVGFQRYLQASDGKNICGSGKTLKEADANAKKRLADYEKKRVLEIAAGGAPTTIRGFGEHMIALKRGGADIRDTTEVAYQKRLADISQFRPSGAPVPLGDMELCDVTKLHIMELRAWLVSRHEGNGARTALSFARMLFNFAEATDVIVRKPTRGVKLPPKITKDYEPPTAEDFQKILALATAAGDAPIVACLVLLWHGLRLGEACGLTWDRVTGNTIDIDRQARRVAHIGKVALAGLKTENSRRKLLLAESVIRLMYGTSDLAKQVKVPTIDSLGRMGQEVEVMFVVCGCRGGQPHPQHVARRIRAYAKTAGLEKFVVHDLRSTALVDATDAGMPLAAVAKMLGQTAEIAMEHYLRLRPAKLDEASLARSKAFEELL